MRKLLAIVMILALMLPVVSLASETYEIAMITDIGTIDDKSFNQGTWEGVEAFAKANGKSYNYYQPTAQSTEIYLTMIEQAVNAGAKVIVTPGFLFEEPIFVAQDMYPDVSFVLIDGNPHNADYSEFRTEKNAVGIVFAEEQAGYLAGYAAVKDGYTKLGFMGGMAVPAVVRFGYGFVQGAEAAAAEMGITGLELNYHYTGGFEATPEAQALAASWYSNGIEVIFACGGAVGNSVMAAAEAAGGKVIGVDVDQAAIIDGAYGEGMTVTSAMKGLAPTVKTMLSEVVAGNFANYGGKIDTLGLVSDNPEDNYVQLPMGSTQFADGKFTVDDYKALVADMFAGKITVSNDTTKAASDFATVITVDDQGAIK